MRSAMIAKECNSVCYAVNVAIVVSLREEKMENGENSDMDFESPVDSGPVESEAQGLDPNSTEEMEQHIIQDLFDHNDDSRYLPDLQPMGDMMSEAEEEMGFEPSDLSLVMANVGASRDAGLVSTPSALRRSPRVVQTPRRETNIGTGTAVAVGATQLTCSGKATCARGCPCKKAIPSQLCSSACACRLGKCTNREDMEAGLQSVQQRSSSIPVQDEQVPGPSNEMPRATGVARHAGQNASQPIQQQVDIPEEFLQDLSNEEVWNFVQMVLNDQPELLAALQQHHLKMQQQKRGTPPPPPPSDAPSGFTCKRCRVMPTRDEQVCCGKTWPQCVSLEPAVRNVCINEDVIITAFRGNRDMLANMNRERNNRAMRHTGYRQFIMLKYGYLGKSVRVVIPSCCVWMIRDRFPAPDGRYTGFKRAGTLAVV